MRPRPDEEVNVLGAAASAVDGSERIVLAVSGGLDSMVLLDAVARAVGDRSRVLVATFDHRSGAHSGKAVRKVRKRAQALGLRCVTGLATQATHREHEWREERWKFLRSTAAAFSAPVFTAHTLDDQIETVFMRILRDAGARGLAGLYAESDVIRPFIALRRSALESYAVSRRITYADDPSNASRAHLRNRVRHEILPAITRLRPQFPSQLLTIAQMAASWREEMTRTADHIEPTITADRSLRVERAALAGYDDDSLRVLWPCIAAKVGIVMDRRGTQRLAEFTMKGHTGGVIQLSGGIEVRMFRDHLLLRRWDASSVEAIRSARLGMAGARFQPRPELS